MKSITSLFFTLFILLGNTSFSIAQTRFSAPVQRYGVTHYMLYLIEQAEAIAAAIRGKSPVELKGFIDELRTGIDFGLRPSHDEIAMISGKLKILYDQIVSGSLKGELDNYFIPFYEWHQLEEKRNFPHWRDYFNSMMSNDLTSLDNFPAEKRTVYRLPEVRYGNSPTTDGDVTSGNNPVRGEIGKSYPTDANDLTSLDNLPPEKKTVYRLPETQQGEYPTRPENTEATTSEKKASNDLTPLDNFPPEKRTVYRLPEVRYGNSPTTDGDVTSAKNPVKGEIGKSYPTDESALHPTTDENEEGCPGHFSRL